MERFFLPPPSNPRYLLHAIDPQEIGKQRGSMLAPRLKIGGEEYEDLDEIISRRVSACNDLVNDLLATPKVTNCLHGSQGRVVKRGFQEEGEEEEVEGEEEEEKR